MVRAFLVTILAALSSCGSLALQWNVEPVYSGGLSQGDCTLLLSGTGAPKVVFSAAGEVRIATRSTYEWPVERIAPCGFWGGWSSAALDRSGIPAAAFVADAGTATLLRFATKASGTWRTEDVATLGWFPDYCALAFDSTNSAWIAFCDGHESPSIKAGKRLGLNNWSVSTVSSVGGVTGPAIAIGPDDLPYISFVDSSDGTVKLAKTSQTGTWTVEPVDGSPEARASWYTSIAFDPSGRPALAYFGDGAGGKLWLKCAVKIWDVWQKEPLLELPSGSAQYASLAFDSSRSPWIAYFNSSASNLGCAWKADGAWTFGTVDPSNMAGYRPSVRLDSSGNPSVSYVDSLAGNISFASGIRPRTLSEIKGLPDGVIVWCDGLVTTTAYGQSGTDLQDRHYVESPDRATGMMVYYGGQPDEVPRGVEVAVMGLTGTVAGERAIVLPAISSLGPVGEVAPLGMSNRSLGGGPSGLQQGATGASGLSNIGLLVSAAGQVVEVDPAAPPEWFKIDDGSGVRVKCLLRGGASAPSGFVTVTGLSSCEPDGSGGLARLIRIRQPSDILNR